MSKTTDRENRSAVKKALYEKYMRLAKVTKSKPRRESLYYHAARFLEQSQQIAREV